MGKTLKNLSNDPSKSYTLTEQELEYLQSMHDMFQKWVDNLHQAAASDYLHNIAVHRFGYAPLTDLGFQLDTSKKENNLQIVNVSK